MPFKVVSGGECEVDLFPPSKAVGDTGDSYPSDDSGNEGVELPLIGEGEAEGDGLQKKIHKPPLHASKMHFKCHNLPHPSFLPSG